MFGQAKAKPAAKIPYVPGNNAFWAEMAANSKKGAERRVAENKARQQAALNFEAYQKSPEYLEKLAKESEEYSSKFQNEEARRKEKELEELRKNPYGSISGVRLRKSRRGRRSNRRNTRRNRRN